MEIVTPDWFRANGDIWEDMNESVAMYHTFHPKVNFLKTLKRNARVLDVGAGDGSIVVFRDWIKPVRKDLRLFAYALEKGQNFDAYDGYEIGRWPDEKPEFAGEKFDAIFSSHFIEHIDDPTDFVGWCVSRLAAGGRIYLEWPSEASMVQPKNSAFHESGIPIIISNYRDDYTHQREIPGKDTIKSVLTEFGVLVDQEGVVTNPYFEEEVLAHFGQKKLEDSVTLTLAYWSRSRWAQYVVGTKA